MDEVIPRAFSPPLDRGEIYTLLCDSDLSSQEIVSIMDSIAVLQHPLLRTEAFHANRDEVVDSLLLLADQLHDGELALRAAVVTKTVTTKLRKVIISFFVRPTTDDQTKQP
jgi:hypothetical protein